MIALDTNVVSELMRATPDPRVLAWMDAQSPGALAITAVSVGELLYGIARLPAGRKRTQLEAAFAETLEEDFTILPFDETAAVDFATMCAALELRGRKVAMADAMIAATCMAAGAALATRNAKDFDPLGIDLIDPWA
jgi:predicted nucleic acid-binding protein